jgi:hypothetical protein
VSTRPAKGALFGRKREIGKLYKLSAASRSCFLTSSKAGVVALAIRDRIRIASRSW